MIDVVTKGHLPDARQAIARAHFPHVQSSNQLQECLLKETVFMLFIEEELQGFLRRSQGTRITLPVFFRASIYA